MTALRVAELEAQPTGGDAPETNKRDPAHQQSIFFVAMVKGLLVLLVVLAVQGRVTFTP